MRRTGGLTRRLLSLMLICGLAFLVGCTKQKTYGSIKFVTNPPGAEVVNLKDDATLGMTPINVTWEGKEGKAEYVTVEMLKTGYKEEITSFWVNKRHATREAAAAEPHPITVDLVKRK